jgi:hypothetical protein
MNVAAGNYSIPFHPQPGIYLLKLEHEGRVLAKKSITVW